MTPKAAEFKSHNEAHSIYKGAWLDKGGNDCQGTRDAKKLRFWFLGGTVRTLTLKDKKSLDAAGFEPRWFHAASDKGDGE